MTASTARNAVAPRDESAVYMAPNGELRLEVRVDQENETVWLTQDQMARLFGSSQRMMSYHINSVISDGELDRKSNIQKMYIDRSKKPVSLHSLDVIISVGYRVQVVQGVALQEVGNPRPAGTSDPGQPRTSTSRRTSRGARLARVNCSDDR